MARRERVTETKQVVRILEDLHNKGAVHMSIWVWNAEAEDQEERRYDSRSRDSDVKEAVESFQDDLKEHCNDFFCEQDWYNLPTAKALLEYLNSYFDDFEVLNWDEVRKIFAENNWAYEFSFTPFDVRPISEYP